MLTVSTAARPARELIESAVATLAAAGVEQARLDAELLMAEATGASRAEVVSGAVDASASCAARFAGMVARRANREPLAYIIGRREFYSLDLRVTPAVLIPRPETETMIDAALALLADRPAATVLDLGTGSGAIALALAAHAPAAKVVGTDISKESLEVARSNAQHLGLEAKAAFVCTDLFDGLGRRCFDLVVSNPPYIAISDAATLAPEVCRFEPAGALFAGPDGLAFHRRILAGLGRVLKPGGALIMEVGAGQSRAVAAIARAHNAASVEIIDDLAGIARVVRVHLSG